MTGVKSSIYSFLVGSKMADADLHLFARPRQRRRPLTYEEKWLVQHVFETSVKEKKEGAFVGIADPYRLTSKYTGVSRSLGATIVKDVGQPGKVSTSTSPGNRQQPTAIPCSTAGRIREFIFDQHRQGSICHAEHVKALLKDEFGLEVHERTAQERLSRMGFWWLMASALNWAGRAMVRLPAP
jgi:hypothetical protein